MMFVNDLVEKVFHLANNGQPKDDKSSNVNWKELKADLEGLHTAQRNLVLKLIEQMKAVNEQDMQAEKQALKR